MDEDTQFPWMIFVSVAGLCLIFRYAMSCGKAASGVRSTIGTVLLRAVSGGNWNQPFTGGHKEREMNEGASIAILFHETTPPNKFCSYRIWCLAKRWTQWGIDVQFVQGPDARIKADLLIPHIDLSVLPEAYRPLLHSRSMVANRNVMDIRKSTFSRNLVFLHDEYDGPVIVKTDSNHGGKPEKHALRRLPIHKRVASTWQQGTRILRQLASTGSLSKLSYAQALSPAKYPVYPSKQLVPSCAFSNPDLVVERFRPEMEGRFYCVRMYEFLGSEGFAIRVRSEHPVVKGANSPHLEFVPVDESIVALRHALGFDHGKFDYVMHDGKAVLLDVNSTPTFGRGFPQKIREQMWDQLARGIEQWFPGIVGSSRAELRSLEVSATRAG